LSKVFVVDTSKQPLNPVHAGRARLLLKHGKAAVYRRVPFTLMLLREVESPTLHSLRVKIDPGSKTTGLAILNDSSGEVVWAAELTHRGQQIKKSLDQRRAARRSRRQRKTRYRKPRFHNRRRRTATLAPSMESRVCNVLTWVHRLRRLCQVTAISQELVRFDTQAMQNPEIAGIQYQQGALMGYEVREYLLEKWQRTCAYCGQRQLPLQIDHIVPRAKAGSDRAANLTLACQACNEAKGDRDVHEFLADKPVVLARVLAQAKAPLCDAAALNSTRGTYVGKVAVRTSGRFNITTNHGIVQGIPCHCCQLIACSDGYRYS
jgi:5-methylcytosine-specific restriction endonuclease McrA